jgi:uncharacterized protein (UPF0276 family)
MDTPQSWPAAAIPACAGIGLRAEHYEDVLAQRPAVGWFEVHSENYFGAGGKPLHYLQRVRELYPLSLHGVGLSLGSSDPLNRQHLAKLKALMQRIEPGLVSEHLAWGSLDGVYFNDLLPLPYTEEALAHMVERVQATQEFLGREILIENASSYLQFEFSTIPEWEFVTELAQRSGCGLLLDVNNIYVNAMNHHFDPRQFLQAVPLEAVKEIHLAGHTLKRFADGEIRIDTHDQLVCREVWALYGQAVARFGAVPVLIEWDRNLPPLEVLVSEAVKADDILEARHERVA